MKLFQSHLGTAGSVRRPAVSTAPLIGLNAFQRVMRLWDAVHPYNGVQVMKLAGTPDIEQLGDCWQKTLATLGIGRITLSGDHYRHDACDPSATELRVLQLSLDAFLSQELNRQFAPGDCPFRPFVIPQDDVYYAGIVYLHWVADSASIRTLMREWFLSVHDPSHRRTSPLQIAGHGYWHYFGPTPAHWRLDEGMLSLLRLRTRFSRVRHTPADSIKDLRVQVTTHSLPEGTIDGVVAAARAMGVTVHDLFLAAIAQAVDHYGATPIASDRDELALGTIVDLRPMCLQNLGEQFGLFFGFTNAIVRQQDLTCWPRLVRRIAAQSAWQKRVKTAQSSTLRLAGALAEAHFTTPLQWAARYRQRMPMAAGVSNVNMNRCGAALYHPPLLEYIRVAPTGPLIPLTFAVTTLGGKLGFTMTRQESLIDEGHAQNLARFFSDRIIRVATGVE